MQVSNGKLPIVVLVSGNGSNLQAIIDACTSATEPLPVEIRAVISNRDGVPALQRASRAGIPTVIIKDSEFANREQYDAALDTTLEQFHPKLVVLAGFLRILSEKFVNRYMGRLINIHPSLLPKYRGLGTHQRAIEAGDTVHGATVHFVTPELDGGPAIIQAQVPILTTDNATSLANRVHQIEHQIYPLVIRWIAEHRLTWSDEGIFIDNEPLLNPIIFTPDTHQDQGLK